jgi:uncharacterized membrane protein
MRELFFGLGFAACHQLPTHSLCPGGDPMPWCARCTGLYLGALLAFILMALFRTRSVGKPHIVILIILGLGIPLLGIDALTSMVGWRNATNLTRLGSGLWMGISLPPLLWALLGAEAGGNKEKPVIGWMWLAVTGGLAILSAWLILTLQESGGEALWWILSSASALGQVLLWGVVDLALAALIIKKGTQHRRIWSAIMAGVLLLAELFLLGMLHLGVWELGNIR